MKQIRLDRKAATIFLEEIEIRKDLALSEAREKFEYEDYDEHRDMHSLHLKKRIFFKGEQLRIILHFRRSKIQSVVLIVSNRNSALHSGFFRGMLFHFSLANRLAGFFRRKFSWGEIKLVRCPKRDEHPAIRSLEIIYKADPEN